jgi:hypothetical protein
VGLPGGEGGGPANGRDAIRCLPKADQKDPQRALRCPAQVQGLVATPSEVSTTEAAPYRAANLLVECTHLWRKNAIGPEPDGEERRVERR